MQVCLVICLDVERGHTSRHVEDYAAKRPHIWLRVEPAARLFNHVDGRQELRRAHGVIVVVRIREGSQEETLRILLHDLLDQGWMLLLDLVGIVEEHQVSHAQVVDVVLRSEHQRVEFDSPQHAVVLV